MLDTIKPWIWANLQQHPQVVAPNELTITPLSGDAGFRQYFRLNTQPSLLAVSAPHRSGNSESAVYFSALAKALRDKGVPVPQVIACDAIHNTLLIEDFGEHDFLSVLTEDSVELLYGEALMVLSRVQQIPRSALDLPCYDQALLRQEMQLFPDWFITQLLGVDLSAADQDLLNNTFEFLEQQALAQPQVLVHRDFHSRNLMYREGEAPGVIDFQDAVWGPITYDLVSLLRDCYIRWSPEQVQRWLKAYGNVAMELGLLASEDERHWQGWFDCMGLQRHIKVLGIFARLFLRDAKPGYLKDLPLVWWYVQQLAQQYPQLHTFQQWCQQRLLPRVQEQDWYREIVSEQKE